MQKSTRSFLGAALGTFLSVWPASTFALAWLIIPGAIFGWLLGYHGDRVWRGIQHASQKIRKDIRTYPEQLSKVGPALWSATQATGKATQTIGSGLSSVLIWLLKKLFMNLLGITPLIKGFKWLKAHPANRATTISVIMNLLGFVSLFGLAGFALITISVKYPEPDGLIANIMMLPVGLSLLGLLASGMWQISDRSQNDTYGEFYGRWDRYNRFKLLFPLVEFSRYVYVLLWIQVTLWTTLSAFVIGAVFYLAYFCVATVLFGLARHTVRFAWRAVRYNRDKGLVSLFVAIITGLSVYHNYEGQMAADPMFRLFVSLGWSLVAGCVAAAVTYLIPVWFKLSYTTRQLLRYKGDATEWMISRPTVARWLTTTGKPFGKMVEKKFNAFLDWTRPNYAFVD